jgi:hypothetical protein
MSTNGSVSCAVIVKYIKFSGYNSRSNQVSHWLLHDLLRLVKNVCSCSAKSPWSSLFFRISTSHLPTSVGDLIPTASRSSLLTVGTCVKA